MAVLSGEAGSVENMRSLISALTAPFSGYWGGEDVGMRMSEETVWWVRKSIHLFEYGVLAVLARRWVGSLAASARWLLPGALGLCAIYAIGDEVHQAFVPERTSSPADALIDLLGAGLGLLLLSARRARRARRKVRQP